MDRLEAGKMSLQRIVLDDLHDGRPSVVVAFKEETGFFDVLLLELAETKKGEIVGVA